MLTLLNGIKQLQSTGNDLIYPEGIFPAVRRHIATGILREDDNSFFTALIAFTLKRLQKYFPDEELKIVQEIELKAAGAFPLYKNKNGEETFNFWRTEKEAHFPNSNFFSKFDYFRLADDADCTAIIYLANGYTQEDITYLRSKLSEHAGPNIDLSKNNLPQYRNLKLYSTWFGKNIPIEVDVCVITNILYLLFDSKNALNDYDLDCIKFICSVIHNNEHKTLAFRVAPYYPNTSIILYHISRLVTIANHPELLQLKTKLKSDIIEKLSGEIHPMEKIILHTSLIWLDENYNSDELEMPFETDFPWFIAGMLTSVGNMFAIKLAHLSIFHIKFYCEAYMKTLFLEYKIEKRKLKISNAETRRRQ